MYEFEIENKFEVFLIGKDCTLLEKQQPVFILLKSLLTFNVIVMEECVNLSRMLKLPMECLLFNVAIIQVLFVFDFMSNS